MGNTKEDRAKPVNGTLFSIGYGDRPWDDFLAKLTKYDIRYLVDVRSKPTSRQSEFNQGALKALLARERMRYVFLGDQLGGLPADPSCYVKGRVDYSICRSKDFFRQGLSRLLKAHSGGHRVAIMCSELDPERCHRSKMIGEALADEGVDIRHIDRNGVLRTHRSVIDQLTKRQGAFSFHSGFRSEKRYLPGGRNTA